MNVAMALPADLVEIRPRLFVDPREVRHLLRLFRRATVRRFDEMFPGILAMAGFLPDEGEALIGNLVWKNGDADRGVNLDLGLFTNVAPGETISEALITEPTGTGYARIVLTDANWTGAADVRSYAEQTFTGGAGGWAGSIQGYFIATKGTTPRLVAIEVDPNGPYTINENDTYKITPNITTA